MKIMNEDFIFNTLEFLNEMAKSIENEFNNELKISYEFEQKYMNIVDNIEIKFNIYLILFIKYKNVKYEDEISYYPLDFNSDKIFDIDIVKKNTYKSINNIINNKQHQEYNNA